jgi:tRNA-dihydrouridine synthase B
MYRPLRIGPLALDGNLVFAPLSGISTAPIRLVMRRYGAALVYSEMVKAQGVVRGRLKSSHYLDMRPEEKPIGVQLADADPDALTAAAEIAVERGADLIDLNCGCPVKKIVKTECGAALLKDPPLIGRILRALRARVPARVPVTLKIRIGWSAPNGPEVARIAEDSGAQAITVHGRTREQLYTGRCDLDQIRAVKEAVSIPVFGNGDVLTAADAKTMLERTGVDGVMIGRGAVGNPWIFRRAKAVLEGLPEPPPPTIADVRDLLVDLLDAVVLAHGPYQGVRMMRKYFGYWTKGAPGARSFRAEANVIDDAAELRAFIAARFGVKRPGDRDDDDDAVTAPQEARASATP